MSKKPLILKQRAWIVAQVRRRLSTPKAQLKRLENHLKKWGRAGEDKEWARYRTLLEQAKAKRDTGKDPTWEINQIKKLFERDGPGSQRKLSRDFQVRAPGNIEKHRVYRQVALAATRKFHREILPRSVMLCVAAWLKMERELDSENVEEGEERMVRIKRERNEGP